MHNYTQGCQLRTVDTALTPVALAFCKFRSTSLMSESADHLGRFVKTAYVICYASDSVFSAYNLLVFLPYTDHALIVMYMYTLARTSRISGVKTMKKSS